MRALQRDGNDDQRTMRGVPRGGSEAKKHTILVKVPAGVEQDKRIRYQGEGESGRFGGPAGDLYVVLKVKAHKFFERDGDDLHCVLPVSFPQAALGAEVQIETLEGMATVKIPEGTQNGREFKLRGKGVPHLNEHGKGDLIVGSGGNARSCQAQRSCCGSWARPCRWRIRRPAGAYLRR